MSWSQMDLSVSTIWTASCMWIIFGMGQVLSFYGFKRAFRDGFAVLLMSPLYYITDNKNHHTKFMKIVLPDISSSSLLCYTVTIKTNM